MIMRTSDVPVFHTNSRDRIHDDNGPQEHRMYSGQVYRVNDLQEDTVTTTITDLLGTEHVFVVPTFRAVLSNKLQADLLFAISETSANEKVRGGAEFNAAMRDIAALCGDKLLQWTKYHEFRSQFLQVAHSYATTVHRAQGASLDIVYTSLGALLSAQPFVARKLAYVGMTRAKRELHLLA